MLVMGHITDTVNLSVRYTNSYLGTIVNYRRDYSRVVKFRILKARIAVKDTNFIFVSLNLTTAIKDNYCAAMSFLSSYTEQNHGP